MAAAERGDGHEPHLYTRRDVFATKADHLQSGWPPDRVTEADVLGGRRGEFESVWCVLLEYGDVRRCALCSDQSVVSRADISSMASRRPQVEGEFDAARDLGTDRLVFSRGPVLRP